MNFVECKATMKELTDREAAKIVFNFFHFQYSRATATSMSVEAEVSAMRNANEAAKQEFYKNNELGGMGGPMVPYPEYYIKRKEEELNTRCKEAKEAEFIFHFIRDRFLDKF